MWHNKAIGVDIHTMVRWTVADMAARNALSIAEEDEGKVCKVEDTGFFILFSIAPDWRLLGTSSPEKMLPLAIGDEETPAVVGTAAITFRMPYSMDITELRLGTNVANTTGVLQVGIKQNGVNILIDPIQIEAGDKSNIPSASPYSFATTLLTDDAEITIDILAVGSGQCCGLKLFIRGT